jgi:hypothetical protein
VGNLLLWLIAIFLLPMALIYPGWCKADQRKRQGASVLFLPLAGMALWGVLIVAGLGAQSLANLIEVVIVCAMAVVVAYVKFHVLDHAIQSAGKRAIAAWGLLAIAVIALRLLMPALPE